MHRDTNVWLYTYTYIEYSFYNNQENEMFILDIFLLKLKTTRGKIEMNLSCKEILRVLCLSLLS